MTVKHVLIITTEIALTTLAMAPYMVTWYFVNRNCLTCCVLSPVEKLKGHCEMPDDIKTDAALLHRLSAAAQTRLTREQLRRQRVSFIYGSLPKESTISRQQIENVLSRAEGEAA